MKMIKITIITIAVIIGLILIVRPSFYKKAFLTKYEFEDFSQFNNACIFIRGGDSERNPILCVDAPQLVNDFSKAGCYFVTLDRNNYQIINAKWTMEYEVNADTAKLQQLSQAFMKYEIPRLDVDEQGNVFVYLADVETLAFARFVNERELLKYPRKWVNVKSNWYKPK